MLHKFKVITPVALVLGLFVFGTVAFAHFALNQETVKSTQTTSSYEDYMPVSPAYVTAPSNIDKADPCTKTISETTNSTGNNATNVKSTNVHCDVSSDNGNSSVNVTTNSSQSATSGDSTGQSGSATNSDSTHIDVNQ